MLPALVDQFFRVSQNCQYERKYRRSQQTATEEDLLQFEFNDDYPIPPASPLHSPSLARSIDSIDDMYSKKNTSNTAVKREPAAPTASSRDADNPPTPLEVYASLPCELHVYDAQAGHFELMDDAVVATVSDIGKFEYWLQVENTNKNKAWLGASISSDWNPVTNFEMLSFVFNHFTEDGNLRSLLLRFRDTNSLEAFQQAMMQAIWERMNQMKWSKIKVQDQEYVLDSMRDLTMEDAPPLEDEEEEEEPVDTEDESVRNEEYDSDEEQDSTEKPEQDGEMNSQLAVGYKHDRSFVVRGSKIGVFKHTPNNHLEFSTNISKVTTPGGKKMNPKRVMLHKEDRDLILQNDIDPNKLYRMDLEYGKVVDEWNVHDDIPVVNFAPENKFAQMTGEQTFLGVSNNALFRIDPRLSGSKLVESDKQQYASKNDFSALATTQKGYMAVASNKGDIRLFDRLGIRAKSTIPALGDPILGMDVSADGRWILGTTKNYILLVDAQQQSGKNEGKLGFEKPFAADSKPRPTRLALTPEHVAQFFHETGQPVTFTPAKFNTGENEKETSIITATGPYIIEWNLNRVLRNVKNPYKIKRYGEEVKADNFKFGSDKSVIVALPNEVNMVAKKSLKAPTRESIMGDPRLSLGGGGRRSSGRIGNKDSGRYKLGRDDIVDSPY